MNGRRGGMVNRLWKRFISLEHIKEVPCQCRLRWGRLWKITGCRGVNQCDSRVLFLQSTSFLPNVTLLSGFRTTSDGGGKKKKSRMKGGGGGGAAAGKTSASEERNNNKGRCARNEKHSSERCLRSYLYPGPCHLRYEITRGQAPVFGGQGAIRAATVLRTLAVEMPPLIKMHGRDDSLKGAGSKRPILLLIRSICRIITRILMRLESNLRRPTSTVPLHMCRRFSGAKPLAFQRECQLTCIVNLTWGDTTPPWFHQWSRHF